MSRAGTNVACNWAVSTPLWRGYTMVAQHYFALKLRTRRVIIMSRRVYLMVAMAQLGMHPALAALLSIVGCMALG